MLLDQATHRRQCPLHLRSAQLAGHLGRFDEAETSYRQALRLEPGDRTAYHGLATLLVLRNEIAEAIRALDQGRLEVEAPDNLTLLLAWLLACSPKQDLRDGPRALELATSSGQNSPLADATRAMAAAETRDFQLAARWQRESLAAQEHKRRRQQLESYEDNKKCGTRSPEELLLPPE